MKLEGYLVIAATGKVRFVKNVPALEWNEVSLRFSLELPDALFARPVLSAKVIIPDEAAIPTDINVEVVENCRNAIETATGMKVKMELVPQKEEE